MEQMEQEAPSEFRKEKLHFSGCSLRTQRRWGSALSCKRHFFCCCWGFFFPPMNNFSSTPPEQRPPRCGGELSSGGEAVLLVGPVCLVCLSVCLQRGNEGSGVSIPSPGTGRRCVPGVGMRCELCLVGKKENTWEKAAQLSWESSWAKG